jgi:hypothetical protein
MISSPDKSAITEWIAVGVVEVIASSVGVAVSF